MTTKRTPKKDEVRIGIVGVGGMGSDHANQLLNGKIKRARLAAVCDIVPQKLERFKDGDIQCFEDSREDWILKG